MEIADGQFGSLDQSRTSKQEQDSAGYQTGSLHIPYAFPDRYFCLIAEVVGLSQKNGPLFVNRKKENNSYSNLDELVKSPKALFSVIPAKAGIQLFQRIVKSLDSGFHRSDDFLRNHQFLQLSTIWE
jgi:hypothetical protein